MGHHNNQQPGMYPDPEHGAYQQQGGLVKGNVMNIIYFAAACCIITGGIIGAIATLVTMQLIDTLEMLYLIFFGVLLGLLDTPFLPSLMIFSLIRSWIARYVNILTRVTGKGVILIFLGATLWAAMFSNVQNKFLLFLAVLFGLFVFLVGLGSTAIGIMKSYYLDKVRRYYQNAPVGGTIDVVYGQYAKLQPAVGLTKSEWDSIARMAGASPSEPDKTLIFNAISSNPNKHSVSKEDLMNWVQSGWVCL